MPTLMNYAETLEVSKEINTILMEQQAQNLKDYPLAVTLIQKCKEVQIPNSHIQGTVIQPITYKNLKAQKVVQGSSVDFNKLLEKTSKVSVAQYLVGVQLAKDLMERIDDQSFNNDDKDMFIKEVKGAAASVYDTIYSTLSDDLQAPTTEDMSIASLFDICGTGHFQNIDPIKIPEWKGVSLDISLTPTQLKDLRTTRSTEPRIYQEVYTYAQQLLDNRGSFDCVICGTNVFNIKATSLDISGTTVRSTHPDIVVRQGVTYIHGRDMAKNKSLCLNTKKLFFGANTSKIDSMSFKEAEDLHETYKAKPYGAYVLGTSQRNSHIEITFTNIDPVNLLPI